MPLSNDFDEEITLLKGTRNNELEEALKTLVLADVAPPAVVVVGGDDDGDGVSTQQLLREEKAFEVIVALPDNLLEREILDKAFLKLKQHSPKKTLLNVNGVAKKLGNNVTMNRAASTELVRYAVAEKSNSIDDTGNKENYNNDNINKGTTKKEKFRRELLIRERLEHLRWIVPKMQSSKESLGQDVVPLSTLKLQLSELWRVYLPLAMILDDLICAHYYDHNSNNEDNDDDNAFIVGISARPGSGKSTMVQILKFLLVEIDAYNKGRKGKENDEDGRRRVCVEVSQDDFYRTKADRNGTSRLEMDGMDIDLCVKTLMALADRKNRKDDPVEIPRFSKAKDDRESRGTIINHAVDVILYEGWRVGIDHPLYVPLTNIQNFLIYIDTDLEKVREWKFEQVRRDNIAAGIVTFDEEALAKVWDEKIVPVSVEYSESVKSRADLILSKGAGHIITRIDRRKTSSIEQSL